MKPARKPPVLCIALRNVLQRSRLEGKAPGLGHHAAAVRAARRVQRRLDEAPLPRVVRELLRDVVLWHDDYGGRVVHGDIALEDIIQRAHGVVGKPREARCQRCAPSAIVERARKVRK